MKLVIFLSFVVNLKIIISHMLENQKQIRSHWSPFRRFSFLEKGSNYNGMNRISESQADQFFFNIKKKYYLATFNIIKDTDTIKVDPPQSFKSKFQIGENIEIYHNEKLNKKIPLVEFMYLDGNILFIGNQGLLTIKSREYKNLLEIFAPKIKYYANTYGNEKFKNFCSYGFKYHFSSKKNQTEISKLLIIICFDESTNEEAIKSFRNQVSYNYAQSLLKNNDFFHMHHFAINQNIPMQYYEHHFNLENSKDKKKFSRKIDLPYLFAMITKEGIVLNKENNLNPGTVAYSFRHDQIVNCRGLHPEIIKSNINPEISELFKSNLCCVSYIVDKFTYCDGAMFCSYKLEPWRCSAEIEIFKASLYNQCMEENIMELFKKIKASNGIIENMQALSFLDKARNIFTLREFISNDFIKNLDPVSKIYKISNEIRSKAKFYYAKLLELIEDQCKESFIFNQNKSPSISQNKKRQNLLSFDNKKEVQNLYSLGLLSALRYEDVRVEICKDLLLNPHFNRTDNTGDIGDTKKNTNRMPWSPHNHTEYTDKPSLLPIPEIIKKRISHEEKEKIRRNSFYFTYENKEFTRPCNSPKDIDNNNKNGTIPGNQTKDKNQTDERKDIPKENPLKPKPEKLPIDSTYTVYSDDPDYFISKMKSAAKSIKGMRNITVPEIFVKNPTNNKFETPNYIYSHYENPYNKLADILDDIIDNKSLDKILRDTNKIEKIYEIIIATKKKLNGIKLLEALKDKNIKNLIIDIPKFLDPLRKNGKNINYPFGLNIDNDSKNANPIQRFLNSRNQLNNIFFKNNKVNKNPNRKLDKNFSTKNGDSKGNKFFGGNLKYPNNPLSPFENNGNAEPIPQNGSNFPYNNGSRPEKNNDPLKKNKHHINPSENIKDDPNGKNYGNFNPNKNNPFFPKSNMPSKEGQRNKGNDPNKSNPSNIGGNDTFKRDNENKENARNSPSKGNHPDSNLDSNYPNHSNLKNSLNERSPITGKKNYDAINPNSSDPLRNKGESSSDNNPNSNHNKVNDNFNPNLNASNGPKNGNANPPNEDKINDESLAKMNENGKSNPNIYPKKNDKNPDNNSKNNSDSNKQEGKTNVPSNDNSNSPNSGKRVSNNQNNDNVNNNPFSKLGSSNIDPSKDNSKQNKPGNPNTDKNPNEKKNDNFSPNGKNPDDTNPNNKKNAPNGNNNSDSHNNSSDSNLDVNSVNKSDNGDFNNKNKSDDKINPDRKNLNDPQKDPFNNNHKKGDHQENRHNDPNGKKNDSIINGNNYFPYKKNTKRLNNLPNNEKGKGYHDTSDGIGFNDLPNGKISNENGTSDSSKKGNVKVSSDNPNGDGLNDLPNKINLKGADDNPNDDGFNNLPNKIKGKGSNGDANGNGLNDLPNKINNKESSGDPNGDGLNKIQNQINIKGSNGNLIDRENNVVDPNDVSKVSKIPFNSQNKRDRNPANNKSNSINEGLDSEKKGHNGNNNPDNVDDIKHNDEKNDVLTKNNHNKENSNRNPSEGDKKNVDKSQIVNNNTKDDPKTNKKEHVDNQNIGNNINNKINIKDSKNKRANHNTKRIDKKKQNFITKNNENNINKHEKKSNDNVDNKDDKGEFNNNVNSHDGNKIDKREISTLNKNSNEQEDPNKLFLYSAATNYDNFQSQMPQHKGFIEQNMLDNEETDKLLDLIKSVNNENHKTPYYLNQINNINPLSNLRTGYKNDRASQGLYNS